MTTSVTFRYNTALLLSEVVTTSPSSAGKYWDSEVDHIEMV